MEYAAQGQLFVAGSLSKKSRQVRRGVFRSRDDHAAVPQVLQSVGDRFTNAAVVGQHNPRTPWYRCIVQVGRPVVRPLFPGNIIEGVL